ncbi:hypothetical protein [Mycolicibacterium komossense]|uniref:Uncharacterized protein n=1 Tax=Mycolicibacterium komossense TaxID=1779 RepID=A0ABT3C9H2_9MYCO|nr:hypothetical protein [Mycolicibacterium komossense]MCV7226083.1 hypothetical protein [Mycolicibacterium komossense]
MTTIPESWDGATAISAERTRQLFDEGYSLEHDAAHGAIQLIDAALAYTVQAQDRLSEAAGEGVGSDGPEHYWPWDPSTFRPDDDALRSIAKAGALLAAAYDAVAAQRSASASGSDQ